MVFSGIHFSIVDCKAIVGWFLEWRILKIGKKIIILWGGGGRGALEIKIPGEGHAGKPEKFADPPLLFF